MADEPLTPLMVRDDLEALRTLIGRLPEMERLVCRLRHCEGMDISDIAACANITERSVHRLLRTSRQRLCWLAGGKP